MLVACTRYRGCGLHQPTGCVYLALPAKLLRRTKRLVKQQTAQLLLAFGAEVGDDLRRIVAHHALAEAVGAAFVVHRRQHQRVGCGTARDQRLRVQLDDLGVEAVVEAREHDGVAEVDAVDVDGATVLLVVRRIAARLRDTLEHHALAVVDRAEVVVVRQVERLATGGLDGHDRRLVVVHLLGSRLGQAFLHARAEQRRGFLGVLGPAVAGRGQHRVVDGAEGLVQHGDRRDLHEDLGVGGIGSAQRSDGGGGEERVCGQTARRAGGTQIHGLLSCECGN